jgi:2-iminobutanoate/2-iminopropanoate deaminase
MSDITHWQDVDEVYADFFGGHRPARAVVPAATLHYGAAIEVEAIARMPDRGSDGDR